MALDRCVQMSAETFVQEVFGRRHLHTPAADPGAFADLFSGDALEDLLARGVRTSSLRLVRDGVERPVNEGAVPEAGDGPGVAPIASTDTLRAALAAGCTLIVRSLHRLHPPLAEFSHDLSHELGGHPVRINAFVTPPHSAGVDLHFDVQDVLVLQIAGHKRWRLRTPAVPDPLPAHAWFDATGARREQWLGSSRELPDIVLRAGDCLYLPRGTFHAPSTGDCTSIHLTVAVSTVTRHDLLTALLAEAAADPRLRQAVSLDALAADSAAAHAELRRIAAILADVAAAADPGTPVWAARRAAFAGVPAEPVPVLPRTRPPAGYRLRRGAQVRTTAGDGGATVVQVGGRRVELPAGAAHVLDDLLRGRRVTAQDLVDAFGERAEQVGQALVKTGLAVPDRCADDAG